MASLTAAANSLLDRLSSVGDALYTKIKHKIYGDRSNLPPRTIYINIRPPKDKFNHKGAYTVRYVSNEIHTTKYNIFTFIPKNLFEQFRRLANFYFLALVILQSISIFEVGSPLYAAAPITFIVFVTAVKDGFEDYRRHLSDIEINGSTAKTLGGYVNCNYLGVRDGWWKKMWKLVTYYYRGLLGRRKRYGVRSGQVHLVNLNDHEMNAIASTSSESEIDPAALDQHRPSLKTLSSRSSSVDSREDDNEEIPSGNLSIVDAALRQSQQQQQPKQVKLKKRKKKRRKKTAKPKPQGWQPRHWEDLMVGDLIFLRNNDSVPADIVLLNTSEPDGVCYVETKNLDGETNLKIRSGFKEFSYLDSQQKIQDLHMTIDVEPPNTHLYSFNATINVVQSTISTMQGYDLEAKMAVASEFSFKLPVTIDELLLRGCTLRNTDWVIGVVVYTGEDTRLLMNSGETPSKRSLIEISMNLQVLLMMAFLFLLCLIIAICNYFSMRSDQSKRAPFLIGEEPASALESFIVFLRALIMLQNLVPISLYVTAEVVKLFQAFFINSDVEMYYEPADQPCITKTWTIADDLGQIEYLFSDKTGTLTRNIMEFRKCSIGGVVYGHIYDDDDEDDREEETTNETNINLDLKDETSSKMLESLRRVFQNPFADESITFCDQQFVRDLAESGSRQSNIIKEFFTHISICHTVLAEYPDERDEFRVQYKAQSPDEAALVNTAKNLGFTFLDRVQDEVSVNVMGVDFDFHLLHVLEFTSDRKRMSVIVRTPDGTILLYCKGADSIIFERLASGQREMKEKTMEHLEAFASEGLRTLCLAYRIIEAEEYKQWAARYLDASTLIEGREEQMAVVASQVECSLLLLGATAIEDQLQEGVPECIARLAEAGIKIWVLTGDKMETAINIGFSCCLLQKGMALVIIQGSDITTVNDQIQQALLITATNPNNLNDNETHSNPNNLNNQTNETHNPNNLNNQTNETQNYSKYALIIDGESLKHSLKDAESRQMLFQLAKRCQAVICCRVSPLQKAQVVQLVKQTKRVTMAIGDGANDVSMIQQANVGVGISGQEGVQAVMASDYAIAQFRFLTQLLLVHGRWAYHRFALMVLLMFHKNFIWTLVLFWYQFYSGFRATILYQYIYILLYNIVFTALTPFVIGAMEQDIRRFDAVQVPQMYRMGIAHSNYGNKKFFLYAADGVWQSLVCYYTAHWIVGEGVAVSAQGKDVDLIVMGTVAASVAVINSNLYMAICTLHWTWLNHFSVWGSILVFIGVVLVGSVLPVANIYGSLPYTYGSPALWFCLPLSIVVCMLPRYLRSAIRVAWKPTDVDLMREITRLGLNSEWLAAATFGKLSEEEEEEEEVIDEAGVEMVSQPPRRQSSLPHIIPESPSRSPVVANAQAFAQRLNQELDKRIGEPLKRKFSEIPARFRRAASLLVMKSAGSHETERNTGFAFSQQPGIVQHLTKLAQPSPVTLRRRRSKFQSDSALASSSSTAAYADNDDDEGRRQSSSNVNQFERLLPPFWVQHLQRALRPISRSSSRSSNRSSASNRRNMPQSPRIGGDMVENAISAPAALERPRPREDNKESDDVDNNYII